MSETVSLETLFYWDRTPCCIHQRFVRNILHCCVFVTQQVYVRQQPWWNGRGCGGANQATFINQWSLESQMVQGSSMGILACVSDKMDLLHSFPNIKKKKLFKLSTGPAWLRLPVSISLAALGCCLLQKRARLSSTKLKNNCCSNWTGSRVMV